MIELTKQFTTSGRASKPDIAFKRISIGRKILEVYIFAWDTSHLRESFPLYTIELDNIS